MNYYVEKGLSYILAIIIILITFLIVIGLPTLAISYVFGLYIIKSMVLWILIIVIVGMNKGTIEIEQTKSKKR